MLLCPVHKIALVEGKPFRTRKQFVCSVEGCDVACWDGHTSTPADQETRTKRSWCHAAFDPMWKDKTHFKCRKVAYIWLQNRMQLSKDECHFGMFSAEQCEQALKFIDRLKAKV